MKKDSKLDYAKSIAGKLPKYDSKEQQIKSIVNTMKKYGDNHWWENKDPRILAYWQVNEPMLIIPWDIFDSGLQNLLGRKVTDKEYAFDVPQLKLEAEVKYKNLTARGKLWFCDSSF